MVKVSVIVPVFNVEKYFDRCMQSLLNQTLKDIEIILVDDESPDNCPVLCDKYAKQDSRVKVIHKKNGGLGYARNSGMEVASGEFIAFVDSDDYVDTRMYERLYAVAKKVKADTVFCGFYKVIDGKTIQEFKEVSEFKLFKGEHPVKSFLLDMIGSLPTEDKDRKYEMSVWRAIYNNEIIKNNKIKFPSEREMISEDVFFHFDYLIRSNILALLPESYYYYCSNGVSLSVSYRKDRFNKYKILRNELRKKLLETNFSKSELLRVDRLFIGYCRFLLFSIPSYNISGLDKKTEFDDIYKDEIWDSILEKYPYHKLPFKHKIILILLKVRLRWVILIMINFKAKLN